jgi:hypothetical protein
VAVQPLDWFCSRRSVNARERMFGTASPVEVWLLLEYNGRWARDLLAHSSLPADVKGALSGALRSIPRSRLLFIRNDLRGKAGLSFFVAIAREKQRLLYGIELDDHRDLLSLDLEALSTGEASEVASGHLQAVEDRLYLVCADGKHDRCCAKFGLPVHRAMTRCAGDAVWQSSHLGGDRFAANVVCLPSGVYYGHVAPEEAPRIVDDTAAGRVYLDKLRGRSCYRFEVQAAEYFARVASGRTELDAFTFLDLSRPADDLIRARFAETSGGRVHVLELERDDDALRDYLTCGATTEHDVPQYTLRAYRVE